VSAPRHACSSSSCHHARPAGQPHSPHILILARPTCPPTPPPPPRSGRPSMPPDYADSRRADPWRLHVAFACACPPSLAAALPGEG
jgi:hypothetical protein